MMSTTLITITTVIVVVMMMKVITIKVSTIATLVMTIPSSSQTLTHTPLLIRTATKLSLLTVMAMPLSVGK